MRQHLATLAPGIIIYLALSALLYISLSKPRLDLTHDSSGYESLATTFEVNNTFATTADGAMPNVGLGYPFAMALVYTIFGHNLDYIIMLQILLGLLCGLLIYAIGLQLFTPRIALISFILFSCNLGFLVFPQYILTETLTVFLIVLAAQRLITAMQTASLPGFGQAGLALSASVLVKPLALYYLPVLLVIVACSRRLVGRQLVYALSCLAGAFYLPIIGYKYANWCMYGAFAVSIVDRETVYYWFASRLHAIILRVSRDEALQLLAPLLPADASAPGAYQPLHDSLMRDVLGHPVLVVKLLAASVSKIFLGLYATWLKMIVEPAVGPGQISFYTLTGWLPHRVHTYIVAGTQSMLIKIISYAEVCYLMLSYSLSGFALWLLARRRRWLVLAVTISWICYALIPTGPAGDSRYRIFFEGIFILLTAYGIDEVVGRVL